MRCAQPGAQISPDERRTGPILTTWPNPCPVQNWIKCKTYLQIMWTIFANNAKAICIRSALSAGNLRERPPVWNFLIGGHIYEGLYNKGGCSGFRIRKSGETTVCVWLTSSRISRKIKRLGQRISKAEERERGGIIQFQCREMKPPAPRLLTISAVSQFCTFLKPLAPSFRKQQATQWNLFRKTRVGGLQHVLFRWICPRKPVG